MSITTKTGDKGMTDGPSGMRVYKDDGFCRVVGSLDEINACIGLTEGYNLTVVQNTLLNIGATLYDGVDRLEEFDVKLLETLMHDLERDDLKGFVLPDNMFHLARAVCRRAEREMIAAMNPTNHITPLMIKYLNRLSDLLFVLATNNAELKYWNSRKV